MRIALLGTVAFAALSLATPSFGQAPSPEQPPARGLERPGGAAQERPQERSQERGLERAQERAQERQERAQERQERAQERQERNPPAGLERRNVETERPTPPQERSAQPTRPDNDRSETPRPPRAAEPASPPGPPQRNAQPARPDADRGETQREAQPAAPRPTPPAAAQPATPPTQLQREAQPPAAPAPVPPTAQPGTPPAAQPPTARNATPPEQRRAIGETIERQVERREVRPERNIGVDVTVGRALPERVRIDRLPREVIDVRPQYRDYGVVVTEEETVIVDPRTRRVVEVIERRGGRGGERGLVERLDREEVREWRNPRVEIRRDVILPREAPLADLPEEYVERTPRYRGYRYVASGDEIAIVEPRSRRVVQVIDRKQARQAQAAPATTASTGGGLSRDERDEINRTLLQRVSPGGLIGTRELRGATLPAEIELQRLPAAVAERSPAFRGMSYVLLGDDVLIVDPDNRRVVDVIE